MFLTIPDEMVAALEEQEKIALWVSSKLLFQDALAQLNIGLLNLIAQKVREN